MVLADTIGTGPDTLGILPRAPIARNVSSGLANRTRFVQAYLDRSHSWVDPESTSSHLGLSYEAYGHHNYAMTVRMKPDETSLELVRYDGAWTCRWI